MVRALQTPTKVETRPVQPGTKWTDDELKRAVARMRAGRNLTPKSWPGGRKVAVCLSWDMDNESFLLAAGNTEPIALSSGEYGAAQALPRIMELYDRYQIPGTFYIPAVTGLLYPQMVQELKRRPQHEIGIHGWIHENLVTLNDRAEEERLLERSLEFWTETLGYKPVGFRAPFWGFSPYTLDLLRKAGFEYDSSAMAMDEPYEIVSNGEPTGLVELPVSWHLDDAPYYAMPRGSLPSATLAFEVYRDEFDRAYEEGSLFMLTMHPMISGQRSRIMHLDRLISYMISRGDVWFATARDIAGYVRQQSGLSR